MMSSNVIKISTTTVRLYPEFIKYFVIINVQNMNFSKLLIGHCVIFLCQGDV